MIKYLNNNLKSFITNSKKSYSHNNMYVRDLLDYTHKTSWDYGSDIIMISPKTVLFNRLILDVSDSEDVRIVCNDLPNVTDFSKKFYNNQIITADLKEVTDLYDGHLIRMYWVNKEWTFATCNTRDSRYSSYKTNKNEKVQKVYKYFYEIIKPFLKTKIDIKKFDKSKTHMFILISKDIYNIYENDEDSMIHWCSFDNKVESNAQFKEIKGLKKTGTMYKYNDKYVIIRTLDYIKRANILKNIPNVNMAMGQGAIPNIG